MSLPIKNENVLEAKSKLTELKSSKALNFVREIIHAMNRSDNPEQLLDQILQVCIESTGADSGSIMLLDSKKECLHVHAARGLVLDAHNLKLKLGEGVTGWVAQEGKARIVSDTRKEIDYVTLKSGLLSELAVPMLVEEQVLGVLSVDAKAQGLFTKEHKEFLSIMANLAAQIFVTLRDKQFLQLRDRFHRVMQDISRIISRSLHLKDIFREVMKVSEQAFRLYRSTLLLYDRKKNILRVEGASQFNTSETELSSIRYAPGEGISGQVFLNKKAIFIPSVKKAPDFLNRMQLINFDTEDLGFFCAPIFSANDVVGVFSTFMRPQSGIDPDFVLEFLEILGSSLSQAITIQKLVEDETQIVRFENIQLKQELSSRYQFGTLIGPSPLMRQLFEKARIVAESRSSVLITGESGTGKELIASALHYNSPRRNGPFIKLNCAAIPANLMESELFGHRKGAFTGAISHKKGKFEAADGGTIFLDEIGELELNLQSKLLRVLQEREIEPVGGDIRQVDIRILAATNADLEQKIKENKFRTDLYYRLNVIHLHIPPLRERKEDILPLISRFIEKYSAQNKKSMRGITPAAVQLLENFPWPGNVRQLENSIERALVLCQRNILDESDFLESDSVVKATQNEVELKHRTYPALSQQKTNSIKAEETKAKETSLPLIELEGSQKLNAGRVYEELIQELERKIISLALRKFSYTKTRAARYLGINRNTLDKKIRELKIET